MEERPPSTAEEFQRVAEEKAKMASQNVDESSYGDAQEGTIDDSKVESVKGRFKEHEVGSDCRRRGWLLIRNLLSDLNHEISIYLSVCLYVQQE